MLGARYMGRQCRRIRKILVAISQSNCFIPPVFSARVAELVDAHDSGSCVRKDVEVRFLSRAPLKITQKLAACSSFLDRGFILGSN